MPSFAVASKHLCMGKLHYFDYLTTKTTAGLHATETSDQKQIVVVVVDPEGFAGCRTVQSPFLQPVTARVVQKDACGIRKMAYVGRDASHNSIWDFPLFPIQGRES
jgi:hypothetical protein